MKLKYVIVLIYVVITVIALSIWLGDIPNSAEQHNNFIESYRIESYSGIIKRKYVDKKQHGYKTIVIDENYIERSILLDYEKGGLYNYLQVGDSVIKKENSLKINVLRDNIDTIIKMKFTNI